MNFKATIILTIIIALAGFGCSTGDMQTSQPANTTSPKEQAATPTSNSDSAKDIKTSKYQTTVSAEQKTLVETQLLLRGVWQNDPVMASGWNEHYQFFPSGKFSWTRNGMLQDCERERGFSGTWSLNKSTLTLKTTKKTIWTGGTIINEPICYFDGGKTEHTPTAQTSKTLQISQCGDSAEVSYYPCLMFDGNAHYRFSDDPTYAGELADDSLL